MQERVDVMYAIQNVRLWFTEMGLGTRIPYYKKLTNHFINKQDKQGAEN